MAKIRLDLSQFKASGVYTLEYDQTESIVLNTQTTRLVVGFSRKGPINAPVFCQDIKTAKRIFGDIDKTLEARGSFFHRSLFTCLETGPCFALALMPLNNDIESSNPDYDTFKSFSLSTTEANGTTVKKLYSSYFNKERFYFPDTSYLLANVADSANAGKLLSFVNLGQVPFSVIVRKTGDLIGFNVTAREWFGAGNVPEYVRDFDYISEYFVQVDLVQGDWTNISQLSTDPVFSQYFDSKGLKKDKIQSFLNSPDVVTLGSMQGCLIPDLVDENGVNYSIDSIINNNFSSTGLFVALDRTALGDYDPSAFDSAGRIDVVGHTLFNSSVENVDFLSYNFAAKETFNVGATSSNVGFTHTADTWTYDWTGEASELDFYVESYYGAGNQGKFNNVLVFNKANLTSARIDELLSLHEGSSFIVGDSAKCIVESVYSGTDTIRISITSLEKTQIPEGLVSHAITAVGTDAVVVDDTDGIEAGDWIYAESGSVRYYLRVTAVNSGTNTLTIDVTNFSGSTRIAAIDTTYLIYGSRVDGELIGWPVSGSDIVFVKEAKEMLYVSDTQSYYTAYEYSNLYRKYNSGIISDGDQVYVTTMGENPIYITGEYGRDAEGVKILTLYAWTTSDYSTAFTGDWSTTAVTNISGTLAGGLLIYSLVGDYASTIDVVSSNTTKTKIVIAAADTTKAEVGQYLVSDPDNTGDPAQYVLTRIISKKKVGSTYELTTNQRVVITDGKVTRYKTVQDAATGVQFTYLAGFKLGTYHLPGTKAQLAKILGMLDSANSNLSLALSDRNMIAYRYIVDTFNGGLDAQSYPKNLISKLAMKRQKCMAILNAPSISEFINSTDPRFTEVPTSTDPKPVLNTSYIAQGGNLALGPTFTYSLPDEENGAKYAGFFAPFLIVRENNKNISIPPAADVSNNFIRKFLNGQPYSIAAGPRRGILSNPRLVSLEYDFSDDDRANLEPFGWNPIVYRNNTGFMIYGNQTAYQKTMTAFNSLHVRDLLITIEESIEDILGNYVFEFNDATTRLEIKSIVDRFLTNVKSGGGIYEFSTVMNKVNNPGDVIDQHFAIIDVGIEPAKGAQKFINRVTVLKTGQISSGGFTVA